MKKSKSQGIADLHSHTTASDGTFSYKALIDEAVKSGLRALAITDHDTVSALKPAIEYGGEKGIEIVPGIEFSCEEKSLGFDEVHILGLFIDFRNKDLIRLTNRIKESRIKQKKEMIKKLNSLGLDINFDEAIKLVGYSFGRPHIAQILVKRYHEKFKSVQDVFDGYIGIGKPAYVERKDKIRIKTAIDIIKKTGGISCIAHPCLYKDTDVIGIVKLFKKFGGHAIEAHYPYNINIKSEKGITKRESDRKNNFVRKLAKENGMLEAGGSDFHGSIRKVKIGDCRLPENLFKKLKSAANSDK